jgi:hypothetical protein
MVDVSNFVSDESRRSVLKKGALATAGAGIVGASADSVAAQEGEGTESPEGSQTALMNVGQARPGRHFVVTSPVIDWLPDVEEIQDAVWGDYNTRVIRYLNSDEQFLFWVAQDAELPEYDEQAGYVVDAEGDTAEDGTPQPEVYEFHREFSPFGDSAYVTLNFAPIDESEEDQILQLEDWWQAEDAEGTATPEGS